MIIQQMEHQKQLKKFSDVNLIKGDGNLFWEEEHIWLGRRQ